MDDFSADSDFDLIQDLDPRVIEAAEDFCRRLRDGESVSVDEYIAANPELESQIRQVFPALVAMERFADITADFESGIKPGQIINDRYQLQYKLGAGGMGEVWVAKQSKPVKRRVALKLIKAGMDTRAVLDRFEQERQALAMMEHPNIARVFDGGITNSGDPFFVMELVNGLPLNKFADESTLSLNQRLDLFVSVCHAVQHAHQKGVVHRDLKPANILVTMVDGKPVPKVIDFGVAKPVKRRVALKLIKAGMDTRAVLDRFEQERQALAMMEHPNIARVFDGGITNSGDPFFVMELVNGLPLNKFADESTLSLNQRLDLFVSVCHAVQHAHQKGVVHRDLKPANILVTMVDGKPVPKVIDFGVAKAIGGKLTENTVETQFGSVVGTSLDRDPNRYLTQKHQTVVPPTVVRRRFFDFVLLAAPPEHERSDPNFSAME